MNRGGQYSVAEKRNYGKGEAVSVAKDGKPLRASKRGQQDSCINVRGPGELKLGRRPGWSRSRVKRQTKRKEKKRRKRKGLSGEHIPDNWKGCGRHVISCREEKTPL